MVKICGFGGVGLELHLQMLVYPSGAYNVLVRLPALVLRQGELALEGEAAWLAAVFAGRLDLSIALLQARPLSGTPTLKVFSSESGVVLVPGTLVLLLAPALRRLLLGSDLLWSKSVFFAEDHFVK